jgi:hypothetical protein
LAATAGWIARLEGPALRDAVLRVLRAAIVFEAVDQTLRASVRPTEGRIVVSPIFSGHIDKRRQADVRSAQRSETPKQFY